jgi:DNA-binding IclR family transcriptional regulator
MMLVREARLVKGFAKTLALRHYVGTDWMPGEREPAARAIDVLVWLADHTADTWGVREVARAMNTSPSTIYRIFQVFESRDLVTKNADGRYTPGLELFRICQVFSQRLSPVKLAKPHLEKLALACGETVLLAAYGARRGQMIVIDIIDAPHPLRWVVSMNRWYAIHSGATGLAMFSFLPEEERKAVYQRELERFTDRTIVNADQLESEAALVRARGYAFSRGQRAQGAVGIGAPLYDAAGDVFGDVCVTIPEGRFDPSQEPRLGGVLVAAAAGISADFRDAGFLRDA